MTQYHSPDRNPVEEMEDIGRMESENKLRGKAGTKYLDREKADVQAQYLALFENNDSAEAASEENRVKVDALVKRIQFGETNTTTVLEPRYQEVVKAARRKSPVGGDTSPSLGQKVRKEREITAGIVEKGERAMVSQEGLLRGKEAVGKGKDGVVVVEMPPRLDVGGLDKVDGKLRVVQKGVKRMTEAMG